jgi:septum formation protein
MVKIILASGSPRRKQLLEAAEIPFEVMAADVDETNPPGMAGELVPEFLARKKAGAVKGLAGDAIIIAADTIVLLDGEILGKPRDAEDAVTILAKLSGRTHKVVSGVCISRGDREVCFSTTTEVHFRELTEQQIRHYVASYKPFDKAGAYAIQEWIGMVGIKGIDGDYYNVMGLPIGEVVGILRKEFALL